MTFNLVVIVFAILLIAKGSDFLTDSLIPLARRLQVSSISLGLVLVSAAVSLPEIFVAVGSGLRGHTDLSLGVTLGSIAVNIAFMTGLSAIVRPLKVTTHMILRDGIFSVVVPILIFAVATDGQISRLDGLAIFLLFIPYLANVFLQERRITLEEREVLATHAEEKLGIMGLQILKMAPGWLTFVLGVLAVLGGSQVFTAQLIELVRTYSRSELLIGLTLGAIGPSIPNVISSYKATRQGLTEVAVSETLGSNIFTLLVTLGTVAVVRPITVSRPWLLFDIPIMILMSLLLFLFMVTRRLISKVEGSLLLVFYFLIVVFQIAFL